MPNFPNYVKICQDLLKDLSPRTKEVISRRFGLKKPWQRETLESIGQSHKITRERIRQIEDDGLLKIKEKTNQHQKAFDYLASYLKKSGGLKREDLLLSQLGKKKFQSHIFFLLTIDNQFSRFTETEKLYPFWALSPQALNSVEKGINSLLEKLRENKEPLSLGALYKILPEKKSLNSQAFTSFVEISKEIEKGIDSFYGLKDWPEIRPRGLKDKAFLALKKEGKPLHFREITSVIDKLNFGGALSQGNKALSQTVHNELIKDPRFVLVGRGIYALSAWGYTPGYVKDIILKVLKEKGKPQSKEEIVKEVLKQRLVKKSTILLNLQNKKYFLKNPDNKYIPRLG
jgi:DNA-directed RNA polymerase delta subunit